MSTAEHELELQPEVDNQVKQIGVISKFQQSLSKYTGEHNSVIKRVILFIVLTAYASYFIIALNHDYEGAEVLLIVTCCIAGLCVYVIIRDNLGDKIYKLILKPVFVQFGGIWPHLKWLIYPITLGCIMLYMVLEILNDLRQLQSLSGLVIFFTIIYFTSNNPTKIRWRPVICGFTMQILMGVVVLRWQTGYDIVKWTSDKLIAFIEFTYHGSGMVYGDPFQALHNYTFMGLSMIIYLGAVLAMLYYVGITQTIVAKAAWFFQVTLGTTAVESLNAASNIFLNGMDTMMMFYPYLEKLTQSEFQCVLVSNHSTVAGFVFGLFVLFGAPPQHLLSAAVMSAPAALAIAKLSYPETEQSTTNNEKDLKMMKQNECSVIEAGVNGAAIAGKTVGTVIVSFIGFISFLEAIDGILGWVGGKVGYGTLSYQEICSYMFAPISAIMGVDWADCREVGRLIGIKVFTSEILGFQELGKSIRDGNLSDRSAVIATYALCGFCGFTTMSIAVGVWNTIVPSLTNRMSSHLLRAVINANISCFMTACIAGLMYDPDIASSASHNKGFLTYVVDFPLGYEQLKNMVL